MPRNKIAKRMNASQKLNQVSLQKIEKDFLTTPSKLAKQLNKEISSLKQKETKLKKEINKNNSQVKTTETRIKLSTKIKTATGKKQLTTAKKILKAMMKNQTGLNKQYQDISKALHQLTDTQAKFLALGKYLKQFDKEWAKNPKNNGEIKTQAPRKKMKKQSQDKASSPIEIQPQPAENSDIRIENIRLTEEATEELVS